MNHPRFYFSMVAIEGKAYAIGGDSEWGVSDTGYTVEEYTPGKGWSMRDDMRLPVYLRYHCSVSIG